MSSNCDPSVNDDVYNTHDMVLKAVNAINHLEKTGSGDALWDGYMAPYFGRDFAGAASVFQAAAESMTSVDSGYWPISCDPTEFPPKIQDKCSDAHPHIIAMTFISPGSRTMLCPDRYYPHETGKGTCHKMSRAFLLCHENLLTMTPDVPDHPNGYDYCWYAQGTILSLRCWTNLY